MRGMKIPAKPGSDSGVVPLWLELKSKVPSVGEKLRRGSEGVERNRKWESAGTELLVQVAVGASWGSKDAWMTSMLALRTMRQQKSITSHQAQVDVPERQSQVSFIYKGEIECDYVYSIKSVVWGLLPSYKCAYKSLKLSWTTLTNQPKPDEPQFDNKGPKLTETIFCKSVFDVYFDFLDQSTRQIHRDDLASLVLSCRVVYVYTQSIVGLNTCEHIQELCQSSQSDSTYFSIFKI